MQYLKGAEVQVLGYTFGYRHQFALLTANYAKLQMVMGLASPLITLSFPYLSWTYGILRRLKIRRRQLHGGSTPPPGTISCAISSLVSYAYGVLLCCSSWALPVG